MSPTRAATANDLALPAINQRGVASALLAEPKPMSTANSTSWAKSATFGMAAGPD